MRFINDDANSKIPSSLFKLLRSATDNLSENYVFVSNILLNNTEQESLPSGSNNIIESQNVNIKPTVILVLIITKKNCFLELCFESTLQLNSLKLPEAQLRALQKPSEYM